MSKNAAKDTFFCEKTLLNCKGNLLDITAPVVMGVVNITSDSFYEGSRYNNTSEIIAVVDKMLSEGAAIIDIGGYSSRPGAQDISPGEEMQRIIPVIGAVIKSFPETIISIDTFRSEVASAAVAEGACIINDIAGGTIDEAMFETVANLNVPYILMHMQGTPQTMQQNPHYDDVVEDVFKYLIEKIFLLKQAGVKDIIVDLGFGFGKTISHNYTLLRHFKDFKIMGCPILAGLSRKSMIYKILESTADEALNGTIVLNTIALMNGAKILRVHDVKPAVEAIKLTQAFYKQSQ